MRRAVLVVLGVYVCLLGALVHRHGVEVGGVDWPWGLVLGIAVTYAVVRAAGLVVSVGGAWFALGWAVALLAQQYSPGGSYLVASDRLGWAFTAGCLGVIVVAVVRRHRLAG